MRNIERELIRLEALNSLRQLPPQELKELERLRKHCKFLSSYDMQKSYYKRTGITLDLLKLVNVARQMQEHELLITPLTLHDNSGVSLEKIRDNFEFVLAEL